MNRLRLQLLTALSFVLLSLSPQAEEKSIATMRAFQPIDAQTVIEPLQAEEQLGHPRVRSYPMQAPTIPHAIDGFKIDLQFNQCLGCHNAQTAPLMKAPAVGLSHYQNRDQVYLSEVSPRRFFCTQCHVPQLLDEPPVANRFGATP